MLRINLVPKRNSTLEDEKLALSAISAPQRRHGGHKGEVSDGDPAGMWSSILLAFHSLFPTAWLDILERWIFMEFGVKRSRDSSGDLRCGLIYPWWILMDRFATTALIAPPSGRVTGICAATAMELSLRAESFFLETRVGLRWQQYVLPALSPSPPHRKNQITLFTT